MHARQALAINLLILLAVLFASTACGEGVRVGDLQTKSQIVELVEIDPLNVDIEMGAGELDVSGGASDLLEATFSYNVEELNPRATYTDGRLEIKNNDVRTGIGSLFDLDEYRNDWDLKFNEDVPTTMNIDLGLGPSYLALATLHLTSLNIDAGAGSVDLDLSGSKSLSNLDFEMGAGGVTIDLTGKWQNDLDAKISGGLGGLNLRLPSDVGVRIQIDTGIGNVDTSGLTRDGDVYTNEAYGKSDVTLRIEIDGGVGGINLDVE